MSSFASGGIDAKAPLLESKNREISGKPDIGECHPGLNPEGRGTRPLNYEPSSNGRIPQGARLTAVNAGSAEMTGSSPVWLSLVRHAEKPTGMSPGSYARGRGVNKSRSRLQISQDRWWNWQTRRPISDVRADLPRSTSPKSYDTASYVERSGISGPLRRPASPKTAGVNASRFKSGSVL